jgi:threonine dehydrogenase-like Zn-dependent dehydrogenase
VPPEALSGAFDAVVTTVAEPETTSGAFDACREAAKVVQASLWPSSSQCLRWHAAPQYVASLQRAHFFAPLAKHTTQICGGSAPRDNSSDATAK